MALTQVKTNAIADDAVTTDKLANAINTARDANTAKVSLTDNSVTLAKMAGGTDGQIITYDANGDPVAVGPGTDGQVLTSTGAGSPPAFEDAVSEGTQVKSTGESGGTKFLREDGDGTCSWQTVSTGTALTGSTDNTITTVTGANAIQGESNLTFDGEAMSITHEGTSTPENQLTLDTSAVTDGGGSGIFFKNSGATGNAHLNRYGTRLHTVRSNNGASTFKISNEKTGGTTGLVEAVSIDPDQNVKVSAGNLVIGTSGKGIDFSATSDATGKSNELLDDYEEGSWTPSPDGLSNTPTYHNLVGKYTKIGNCVKVQGFIQTNAVPTFSDTSLVFKVSGLPFASNGVGYLVCIGNVAWQGIDWVGASQSTYGHNDDTIIQAGIVSSTKTTFRTMGKADYYMGELKNTVFHDNGWILEWDMCYYV